MARREPPQVPIKKTVDQPQGNPAGRAGTPDFKIAGKPVKA